MSYFIMVITGITDIFMSIATPFELKIKASWNWVILVLLSLTSRDVSQYITIAHIFILNKDIPQESSMLCNWLSLRCLLSWISHMSPVCETTFDKLILNDSWYESLT